MKKTVVALQNFQSRSCRLWMKGFVDVHTQSTLLRCFSFGIFRRHSPGDVLMVQPSNDESSAKEFLELVCQHSRVPFDQLFTLSCSDKGWCFVKEADLVIKCRFCLLRLSCTVNLAMRVHMCVCHFCSI